MPVSAPIKFFDASPISFSTKFSSSSPLPPTLLFPPPFPLSLRKKHGTTREFILARSCALKSEKRIGEQGDRNGYFALSTSWPTVLFTTGSLSAKTMRLERSSRKEREREIEKERDREIDRDRKRESKRKTRKNCGTKPRAYTSLVLFPSGGNSYSLLLLLSRMDHAAMCWKAWGECGCEMDVCRWGIRDNFSLRDMNGFYIYIHKKIYIYIIIIFILYILILYYNNFVFIKGIYS